MGLLNKANGLLSNENLTGENRFSFSTEDFPAKKKSAENIKKNESFAFSDFIKKYGVSSFAICRLAGDFFVIKDSLGFDGKTISRFMISVSDCVSLFRENKNIAALDVGSFDFLSSVFSDIQRRKNPRLSFCKVGDNFFMICDREITTDFLNDFFSIGVRRDVDFDLIKKKFSQNYNAYAVKIDFCEALETFFCAYSDKKIEKSVLFSSIFEEICNRFFLRYNSPRFSKQSGDYILKSCFFTKEKIPDEILINHIIFNLKEVLENSAEIINIAVKKTENFLEIQHFYEAE